MKLSKYEYTKGIHCPKGLWLAKLDISNVVGEFASKLFPDGKEVPFTKIIIRI